VIANAHRAAIGERDAELTCISVDSFRNVVY